MGEGITQDDPVSRRISELSCAGALWPSRKFQLRQHFAAGVISIGRWQIPRSFYGWRVVEGEAAGVAELSAMWGDLLELQRTPVIEDAEAAGAVATVHRE
ncbi:MAG TPA: DUF3303 family protein [Terracidiphilus sp.]|nr:DUF3303 family protein [Terracidiphilus sp.]